MRLFPISIALLACLRLALPAAAEDWSHWRGDERDGVVSAHSGWTGTEWPLTELWRKSVGEGSSSPLVIDGRLYTLGWKANRDDLQCLDADSGETLWSVQYDCPRYGRVSTGDKGIYSGPSSTPEYDPQTRCLYTLSTDGDLSCWDTGNRGKQLWHLNLYEQFDIPQRPRVGRSGRRDYGFTSSPLVHQDWLIVEAGARQGNLIALDKRTGRLLWQSESKSPAGHNGGPVPITVEGVPCVAVHNHQGLLVTRLDPGHEGETVATVDWVTSFANNIATAAVHKNTVLLTSGYNQNRMAKYELSLAGARQLWEQAQVSKVCTPVIHQGHVYWAWRNIKCLDFATGQLRWQGGRAGDPGSCIVTGDDRLITWTNNGDLLLSETAARSPDRYTELARHRILSRQDAWPHVVLSGKKLYCKDRAGTLVCLELGGE